MRNGQPPRRQETSSGERSGLAVRELSKTFHQHGGGRETTAVRPTTLDIPLGTSLGVVGESGSGKTTLARMICGLTTPTSGMVSFAGIEIHRRRDRKSLRGRIQMVFQDPYDALNPRIRVGDSVAEPILLSSRSRGEPGRPISRAAARDRVVTLLEQVQLDSSFLDRYPAGLSGGQLQRVGIARALAASPELIVLDEPTSALDWMTRAEIVGLLGALRRDLGLTYLFISHDIGAVAAVSDQVVVMYRGDVVETGTATQVLDSPQHPYTKALVAAVLSPTGASRPRRIAAPTDPAPTDPAPTDPAPTDPAPTDPGPAEESGCRYYARCIDRIPACATTPQRPQRSTDNRDVACMRVTHQHASLAGTGQ